MTDTPNMKTAAIRLHDAGWWTIPNHWVKKDGSCSCDKGQACESPGKHPLCSWKEAQTRRFTREEVEIWWDTYPPANIGVITGPESSIVCLDIDVKEGVNGHDTVRKHADEGRDLPPTFTDARGEGEHRYFRYPKNAPRELRNIQDGKLGPGLDLRAGGGQVIVAPSMHYSRKRRRIVDPRSPVDLPQWVIDLALSAPKPEKAHDNATSPHQQTTEKISGLPPSDRKRFILGYLKKHFPEKVVSGNRHHAFMQIAGVMRSAGSEPEEIFDYLTDFNIRHCDPPKPDAESEIRGIAGYMAGKPVTMRSKKVNFSAIADEIRQGLHVISVRQNLFYRDNGVYCSNTGQIEARIQAILTGIEYDKSLVTAKREILSNLSDHEPYQEPPFNKHPGYIPVRNGILHIEGDGITLIPYDDDFLFSYRLPVTFDPDADSEPIRDVFSDWVDDENVIYLIQLPAQAIVQSWGDCFKTAYLFEGPKNAAKTTYLEFLGATIGSMNYSTTPLSDLLYNKYAKYDLLGKILNLSDDLSEIPLNNLGEFKKLTGGMPITVERKHCDRITMPLPAVHAFTCNRPPKCSITDDPAWWDRWVYVYFGNTFPINPQWKKGFITSENLSGFLLLIIDAIAEIMAGKFQRMDPKLVEMMWTSASDTVSKFLLEDCTLDPEGEVSKDDFFEAYCSCCKNEKKTPIPRNALTRELAKKSIIATRLNVRGRRVQAYRGVFLKNVRKNPDHPDQTILTDNLGQGSQGFFNLRQMRKDDQKDSTCTRVYACNSENTLTTLTKVIKQIPIRILQDVGPIAGSDGREYDLRAEDIVTLPDDNARALIERHAGVEVKPWKKPVHIHDLERG